MYNNKLFAEFCEARNLKNSTINGYESALKLYTLYCKMNLNDLINEAYLEEEKNISLKKRRIKKRLIGYRVYLLNNLSQGSVRNYFSKVKTFYRHFEVELPNLPPFRYGLDYEIHYNDLPSKEDIKKAISSSSNEMRAIILFMASSGTAKAETLSLTVNDFVNATNDYHNNDGLQNVLDSLGKRDDVVPTWYLKRIKTNKYYYTFNNPEASNEIVKYLKNRENLDLNDKLFPLSSSLLLGRFQRINDRLGWGFKGNFRFFRSHTLRKFHASNIGLSAEHVDTLQGRRKNIIHETYIKPNPNKLKKIYMKSMSKISIFDKTKNAKKSLSIQHKNECNISINIWIII